MKPFVTSGMKTFFASPSWQAHIRGDVLIYQAAYASLDKTIDALGRKRFQEHLDVFCRALQYAHRECSGKVITTCTEGGQHVPHANNMCYQWAEGCDHVCLDALELPDALEATKVLSSKS